MRPQQLFWFTIIRAGSAKPSSSDIELTAQIVNACKAVNVSVHDHVIIGKSEYYSFKTNMLL